MKKMKLALVGVAAILAGGWFPGVDEAADFNLSQEQLRVMVTNPQIRIKEDSEAGYICICGPSVAYNGIPKNLINALIATEDRRFHDTKGWDLIGIVRALFSNLADDETQGGSGIAIQACKNLVLSPARTARRKINEIACAKMLDQTFSKEEMLEIYFNGVDYGTNVSGQSVVGVLNASLTYFGKLPSELSLYEAAGLVGLLKNPNMFSPIRNKAAFQKRANIILYKMKKYGFITHKEYTVALSKAPKKGHRKAISFEHRYFTQWIIQKIARGEVSLSDGDRIPLTFQPTTQSQSQAGFAKGMDAFSLPKTQPAAYGVMAIDGRVLAMMGGQSFGQQQFNAFTDGRFQPGSAFKPLVYATALENGLKLGSRLYNGKRGRDTWKSSLLPANPQLMSVKQAFAESANIPAIRALNIAGPKRVIEKARLSGVVNKLEPNESLGLGAYEVSPLELTAAYTPFGNGGKFREAYGHYGIVSKHGVLKSWNTPKTTVVYAEQTSKAMRTLLRAVVTSGTGKAASSVPGAMGKTGTTNDNLDAWFVGLTAKTITTVWTQRNDEVGLTGKEAAHIWAKTVQTFTK